MIPSQGTGVASYLSCMPDEPTSFATQLGYQLNNEYQKCLILCNDRLQSLNMTSSYVSSYD